MFKRKLLPKIVKHLKTDDVIVIYGARQVGKTTLLQYILEHEIKENYLYIDLERMDMLELCEKNPEELYTYLLARGLDKTKKITVAVDEIQYLSNPTNFIKLIHDHFKNIKLLVSGSSSFEIKKKFKDSLAGRTVNFTLYPLDFQEFLQFKKRNYELSDSTVKPLINELSELYQEYVLYGGYPKIVLADDTEFKKAYLNQLITTYVKKDIKDIGNINNISAFNKLLHVLASQSGNLLNISDISSIVGISQKTVENYIFLLEQTFIIKLCYPFHKNLRIELSKTPKVYFIDSGLMQILSKKIFGEIVDGNLLESVVYSDLIKNNSNVNYWRTTNKQEIDFIIEEKLPIEVKLNFSKAKSSAMLYFNEKYNVLGIYCCLFGEKKSNTYYPWELLSKL